MMAATLIMLGYAILVSALILGTINHMNLRKHTQEIEEQLFDKQIIMEDLLKRLKFKDDFIDELKSKIKNRKKK